MSSLRVGPRAFLALCRSVLAVTLLNVVTGAAVRLSDSGLGCPDWPTCYQHQLTPPLLLHPVVEFANRAVVALLVVACGATFVASFFRRPVRRDLRWLSGGLIAGVVGEAVLGAFVVYSKLNAYVVVCHFLVGMALLAVAVILALRADHAAGRGRPAVAPSVLRMGRALVVLVVLVLAAGAATTGAGPHAGGKGAKRIPVALNDMTRVHAEIVLLTIAAVIATLWLLHRTDAPARIQDNGRLLLVAMVVQGAIGYLQFFTHLPAVLVGVHVLGASVVWSAVLWFDHGLSDHDPELAAVPGGVPTQGGVASDPAVEDPLERPAGVRA